MISPDNIIAVGGGKGGAGKSVLCTNLAAGLALSGKNVVLMDADLGASNLHALLGIDRPHSGFRNWFLSNSGCPDSLFFDTGIANLKFISGAGDHPGSADLCDASFAKIPDLIQDLKADCVFLDLGSGTQNRTLDLFNLSAHGIVVTTPEITASMKTFGFIRAALFRKISRAFAERDEIVRLVDHSDPETADLDIPSVGALRDKIQAIDSEAVQTLESIVNGFAPLLVVNRVRKNRDLGAADQLIQLVKKHLDVTVPILGYVIESERVRDSVDERIPFLIKEPQSKPSVNVLSILGALFNTQLQFIKKDGRIFISRQADQGD